MSVKDKDLELWQAWNKSKSTPDLEALMKQMAPILRRETARWSSLAPAYVLENEAKRIAIAAFAKYNPHAGAALSTYLTSALQKLSRTAYQNQSTLSVPEHQRLGYNQFLAAQTHLTDLNGGRKPELADVADYLSMSPKKLQVLVETVGKRELTESGEGPEFVKDIPDDVLDLAVSEMTPLQKEIFKRRTGYERGHLPKPIQNAATIQRELKITQGQLSYQLLQIKALLVRAQRLR